eukprot:6237868-Prymnesium_polylepis.1
MLTEAISLTMTAMRTPLRLFSMWFSAALSCPHRGSPRAPSPVVSSPLGAPPHEPPRTAWARVPWCATGRCRQRDGQSPSDLPVWDVDTAHAIWRSGVPMQETAAARNPDICLGVARGIQ